MTRDVHFDTHLYVKKLQDIGFPEQQAEKLVDMVREMQEAVLHQTVRPQALEEKASKKEADNHFQVLLKESARLRTDIEVLRKDVEVGFERTKNDVFKWILPLFLGQYALLIGLFATLVLKH